MDNDGRLTKDKFAVAMHLIQARLGGKDLPTTLPQSLVPPAMRAARAPAPAPKNPLQDLLWDDPPSSATQPQVPFAQPTGALSSVNTGRPTSPPQAAPMGMRDPFGGSLGGPTCAFFSL